MCVDQDPGKKQTHEYDKNSDNDYFLPQPTPYRHSLDSQSFDNRHLVSLPI